MNIFEALEKGNGKATHPSFDDVAYWKDGYGFCWERNHYPTISFSHLKCNDWKPYVPRGTCSNCGQVMPPQKTKHKEVFENVSWFCWPKDRGGAYVIYPDISIEKKHDFIGKPLMKMTLEWEE